MIIKDNMLLFQYTPEAYHKGISKTSKELEWYFQKIIILQIVYEFI